MSKYPYSYTLCDPRRGDRPQLLDYTPTISVWRRGAEFMYWQGELREIREIHTTKNGTQIQLF